MIAPKLVFDLAPFARDAERARILPALFLVNLRKRMKDIKSDILTITTVTPGPVVYPVAWKTERQRLAFYATDGFGKGIPTGRVHEPGGVLGGYDVLLEATPDAGEITLVNTYPNAVFIVGEYQQPFHQNTGWVQVDTVMPQNQVFAVDAAFDVWDQTVRETA